MPRLILPALLVFAAAPAFCETAEVSSPAARLESALSLVRAGRKDLAIRTDRWDTSFKLPAVEALLEDPLQAPEALEGWSRSMDEAPALAGLLSLGAGLLGAPETSVPAVSSETINLPSSAAAQAVAGIIQAMAAAQPLITRAESSLGAGQRELARLTISSMIMHEYAGRKEPDAMQAAYGFDEAGMLRAAGLVAAAVERALPVLQSHASEMKGFPRTRWKFPFGDVLVSGTEDDRYEDADLENVALLVDFGGNNVYRAPLAAAGPGQQRIVIDLGADVRVEAGSSTAAGSGVFGVGLLYLPNPEGRKTILAGDFSLGAGLFGVGGLFLRGSGNHIEGGRFTSGAGAFGVGALYGEGDSADFSADLAGQGFAFTRGIGLFKLRGSKARLTCGLRYPDAHEPLAMLSLCQGVGYGPRAFAAGGVGLAYIAGDEAQLRGSYFAQGSGYWHGLGGLFLKGDGSRLQARRYSQGAGIHTAVGALVIKGDANHLRNWGAGPALGWDFGIGLLLGEGDHNSVASEWASARGDVNGHGLAAFHGRGNSFALSDMGTGYFKRGAPSYGLAALSGEDNRYRPAQPCPWGIVQGEGLFSDESLQPEAADWPSVEREPVLRRDRERLQRRLAGIKAVPWDRQIETVLSILSEESLDQNTPMQAAASILDLPSSAGASLARWVSPERFDEFIWLAVFIPAFGRTAAVTVSKEMQASPAMRRAVLIRLLGGMPAAVAAPVAASAAADADWRVRRSGLAVLGSLFDREEGDEPGRLRLDAAAALCRGAAAVKSDAPVANAIPDGARHGSPTGLDAAPLEPELSAHIGGRFLSELLAVLALDDGVPPDDRVRVLLKSNPLDRMGPDSEGVKEFIRALRRRPEAYGRAIEKELEGSGGLARQARQTLLRALESPEQEVVVAAVMGLGQLGEPQDAPRVAGFLRHDSPLVREAAAASLGKMGAAAQVDILRALKYGDARVRALAALAAAQSGDPAVVRLLPEAFADRDREVRRTAITALSAVQGPYVTLRRDFLEALRSLERGDPDVAVRLAAGRAAKSIAGN